METGEQGGLSLPLRAGHRSPPFPCYTPSSSLTLSPSPSLPLLSFPSKALPMH